MPLTSSSWSTLVNGPCAVRWSTIRWARTGPMPGSASRSATVAAFRSSTPPLPIPAVSGGPLGAAAPGTPTAICWPSVSTAAALTEAGSASGNRPPTALRASATRDPDGSVTRPGAATWPITDTTTVPAVAVGVPAADVADVADGVPGPAVAPVAAATGTSFTGTWSTGTSSTAGRP